MEIQKIEKYVDNLDVNTQADLLKKVLDMLINLSEVDATIIEDVCFIQKQIEEFNENYTEQYTKQELKQFDSG